MRLCSGWRQPREGLAILRRLRQHDRAGRPAGARRRASSAAATAGRHAGPSRRAAPDPSALPSRSGVALTLACCRSVPVRKFDLLRPIASIQGPLRSSTQPRMRIRWPANRFRLETGGHKASRISFRNRDREVRGPPSAEIHVDRRAAVADGQNLALHDGESAAPRRQRMRPIGLADVIIRIGPKAKLGGARDPLGGEKLGCAGSLTDSAPNHRFAGGEQLLLQRGPLRVLGKRRMIACSWP